MQLLIPNASPGWNIDFISPMCRKRQLLGSTGSKALGRNFTRIVCVMDV